MTAHLKRTTWEDEHDEYPEETDPEKLAAERLKRVVDTAEHMTQNAKWIDVSDSIDTLPEWRVKEILYAIQTGDALTVGQQIIDAVRCYYRTVADLKVE